jgi:hypothetical protein
MKGDGHEEDVVSVALSVHTIVQLRGETKKEREPLSFRAQVP